MLFADKLIEALDAGYEVRLYKLFAMIEDTDTGDSELLKSYSIAIMRVGQTNPEKIAFCQVALPIIDAETCLSAMLRSAKEKLEQVLAKQQTKEKQ